MILSSLFSFVTSWTVAVADSVTLESFADTGIFELDPGVNMGRNRDVPAGTLGSMGDLGRSRMLLQFGVATGVPAGSTITGGTLRMRVTRTPESGKVNSDFALHRMMISWNEGDGIGDIPGGRDAVDGETTWSHRIHPNVPWETPGVALNTEFTNTVSASTRVFGNGEYTFEFTSDGIADLQEMLDDPCSNSGWIFKSQSEATGKTARRWGTKENLTPSYRPRLEITFDLPTEPPPAPEILESSITDSEVTIRFAAMAGIGYFVQSSSDIELENWVLKQSFPIPVCPTELIFTAPLASSDPREFFRIRAEW